MVEYIPGEQNIGRAGQAVRYGGAALCGGVFLYLLSVGPRFFQQPAGFGAAVFLIGSMFFGFYQAESRFCGTLGLLGLYKVDTAAVERVDDATARQKDRVTALHEFAGALLLGLIGAAWVYALSVLA